MLLQQTTGGTWRRQLRIVHIEEVQHRPANRTATDRKDSWSPFKNKEGAEGPWRIILLNPTLKTAKILGLACETQPRPKFQFRTCGPVHCVPTLGDTRLPMARRSLPSPLSSIYFEVSTSPLFHTQTLLTVECYPTDHAQASQSKDSGNRERRTGGGCREGFVSNISTFQAGTQVW